MTNKPLKHAVVSSPLEEFLRINWHREYTLKELADRGDLGTMNQLRYTITRSQVIRRKQHGKYQFSALGYGGYTTIYDHVKKLLVSGEGVSVNALAREFGFSRTTIQTVICKLRKEGMLIVTDLTYTVKNAPKRKSK
ncbi:MAG: HTH domain-containing protein [Shewanella sp.]